MDAQGTITKTFDLMKMSYSYNLPKEHRFRLEIFPRLKLTNNHESLHGIIVGKYINQIVCIL